MKDEQGVSQQFADRVAGTINRGGFAFQHRVALELEDLEANSKLGGWRVYDTEMPVQVHGHDTSVDILVGRGLISPGGGSAGLINIECKRVDPALGQWCFFQSKQNGNQWPVLETIFRHDGKVATAAKEFVDFLNLKIYDTCIELKTKLPGDGVGRSRSTVDIALSQVIRSSNGLFNTLAQHQQDLWRERSAVTILPMIVTTAELIVCSADFRQTDITTGKLTVTPDQLSSVPSVYVNYPVSISLKHSLPNVFKAKWIRDFNLQHYSRTIAIVNAAHLEEFFSGYFGFDDYEVDETLRALIH